MLPCLEGEGCDLLINRSGWTCTQPGGRIKTTTVSGLLLSWGHVGEGEQLQTPEPARGVDTRDRDGTGSSEWLVPYAERQLALSPLTSPSGTKSQKAWP
jgi:hypothetical protein